MQETGESAFHDENGKQNISEAELRLLLENMISPFSYYRMIYDNDGNAVDYVFLAVNRAFETETGLSRESIIGKSARSVFPQTEPYWIECFARVAKTGVSEHISDYSAALGRWYNVLAYSPLPDHVAITVSDISDVVDKQYSLKETAEALKTQREENHRLAHEEPITGLPNRLCLYGAIAEHAAVEHAHFSIAIFAPDNLSEILASYGSVLSDAIMQILAQRLHALFPNACFSMTGTDLVLLVNAACNGREMDAQLDRAQAAIREPVEVEGASYYLSASCGAACSPMDGTEHDELIMRANLALYQAKRTGNAVSFYNDQIGQTLLRRTNIRNALPKALENEEFELFFQPQIHPLSERLLGFEALIRWHNPTFGDIPPLEFIGIAEENRLIHTIGDWVLQNACQTIKRINDQANQRSISDELLHGCQRLRHSTACRALC